MKRLWSASLLVLAIPIGFFAQPAAPTCTNETVSGISSRGIAIGAKLEDILNLFAKDDAEKAGVLSRGSKFGHLGYLSFSIPPRPADTGPDGRFEGITNYHFTFLDKRLTGFSIYYSKPMWASAEQFADLMSERLRDARFHRKLFSY